MNTLLLAFSLMTSYGACALVESQCLIYNEYSATIAEAQWKCRRCGQYNWSAKPPYSCNNCSCTIGEC
jgi:hypothetical protein